MIQAGNLIRRLLFLPESEKLKKKTLKTDKSETLRTGFEPAREYPIGFRVQRLNHSAIAAVAQ